MKNFSMYGNNSVIKQQRQHQHQQSKLCRIRNIGNIFLLFSLALLSLYGMLWIKLIDVNEDGMVIIGTGRNTNDNTNDNGRPLTKEEKRQQRRERLLERKKQARDDYKVLRNVKKETRERNNRTEHSKSPILFDFEFSKPPMIPNLIWKQKQQQRMQQQQQILERNLKQQQQEKSSSLSASLFLNYQLLTDHPYNITYGQFTTCKVGVTTNKWGRKPIERVPLATPEFDFLQDFTTTIETNLRILSLGDSVGIQFHQLLEEAAGALPENREMYRYAWGEHESTSVAAPIHGGGVLAAFRMTGMFLEKNKGKPPPNSAGGGWLPDHVQELLQHKYNPEYNNSTTTTTTKRKATTTVDHFDAMIFRIPHGWLTLEEITKDTLIESIQMAHKVFGIKIAVVLTLPFNNNVQTEAQLNKLHLTNAMIRDVVSNWNTVHPENAKHFQDITVLLMEFGDWADQIMHRNAKLAGMDQTYFNNYTLARLGCTKKFPPSLAMVCTEVVPPDSCSCKRNMISIDGLHWCMESIGGRVIAAMACLLQCPLLQENKGNLQAIKTCERNCNQRFMSLERLKVI